MGKLYQILCVFYIDFGSFAPLCRALTLCIVFIVWIYNFTYIISGIKSTIQSIEFL